MIEIRVTGWNESTAWVGWSEYHRSYIESRLAVLSDADKQTAKCFARAIRDKCCAEIALSPSVDPFNAERFREFLESLGAVAIAEEA